MKKNILFCGTPQFAVASLKSLFQNQKTLNYNLVGAITIPDKVSGRGLKKQKSAIKKEAEHIGIKIFQPIDLSDTIFINSIKKLNLDLIIVVAFKKLPTTLFELPKIGTINLHASLLPKYRGAAPINWAIIKGEKETGLTTFFINNKIDTGDIILQSKIKIDKEWHANDLHDILMQESNQIIEKTIKKVFLNSFNVKKQIEKNDKKLTYAPKIKKRDFITNSLFWYNNKLIDIYNFIRGMAPPGIKTSIVIHHNNQKTEKNIIITRVSNYKLLTQSQLIKLCFDTTCKNEILITNGISSFNIKKLKIENGKEISDIDFYNGFLKNKISINKISINE